VRTTSRASAPSRVIDLPLAEEAVTPPFEGWIAIRNSGGTSSETSGSYPVPAADCASPPVGNFGPFPARTFRISSAVRASARVTPAMSPWGSMTTVCGIALTP
jgi:hypothetical protein